MPPLKLEGRTSGLLTALSPAGRASNGSILWRCSCRQDPKSETLQTANIHRLGFSAEPFTEARNVA